jgi:hypothetical protein
VWNLHDLLPSGRGDREPDNTYSHEHQGSISVMIRWLPVVLGALGVLLFVIGGVWTLQGAGLLGGSFMTGSRTWLVIGLLVLIGGLALISSSVRNRARH